MTCEFAQAVVSHPLLLINDAIVFKKCKNSIWYMDIGITGMSISHLYAPTNEEKHIQATP